MKPKPPPKGSELRNLVRKAQAGDRQARNEMVVRNMGLVEKPATYFARRNPGIDLDDLWQAGRIGLIRAVEKFDVMRGFKFSTYADHWVRQELRRMIRAQNARGISSTLTEASNYMEGKLSAADTEQYEAACLNYISLDSPAVAGDSHSDQVRDVIPSGEDVAEDAHRAVLMQQVELVFQSGKLTSYHRKALMMYFTEDLSNEQISRSFKKSGYGYCTPALVQKLIDESLVELRASLGVE